MICYGIVSRVAAPLAPDYALFRPIRIHPMLGDELRAIADRYEQVVCIEANDGQYADMAQLALRREVKRVPLLGGRISLEAVRDGLERVLVGRPVGAADPAGTHRAPACAHRWESADARSADTPSSTTRSISSSTCSRPSGARAAGSARS